MRFLTTNRDLYLAIENLCSQHKSSERVLEQYLLAMLQVAQQLKAQSALSLAEFYHVLASAFTATASDFDADWRVRYDNFNSDDSGYEGWRATLIRQIVDLREMAENRSLENEYRYFGISSPRGSYWYNFDAATYIECAMEGSFGGWEPGDDTGRDFVPGECAVLDSSGEIRLTDPRDVERPVVAMSGVSWAHFKTFIECGQMYE